MTGRTSKGDEELPKVGLEPTPPCGDRILSPARIGAGLGDSGHSEETLHQALARESQNDRELAALFALWPKLPESGRKLLLQTAETLTGTLPMHAKDKRRDR